MSPAEEEQPLPVQNTDQPKMTASLEHQSQDSSAAYQGTDVPRSPDFLSTTSGVTSSQFPVAQIRDVRTTSSLILSSKMWWVTALCLLLAFWLTWRSIPANGPTIVIQFSDGHGLKSGDAVRHRGIDVGTVSEVVLSSDLSQIAATVVLTPEAKNLAREGTRFWIVRPQLSLTGVSGLETAVGAKYIAVSPGEPSGIVRKTFDGLAVAPPDENDDGGIDIVLRSDARHGVTVGSPIAWRGVDVGQTLSIHLSPDARFVDIHARIQPEYSRLLQRTSQFWVTSGLGVDVGLSGLHLNADSLSSIVRGGISFTTPAISDDKTPVQSGQMFVLHEKPDPAWLNSAASLPLIDFRLPPTVMIHGTRKTSLLGIPRTQRFSTNGLIIQRDANTQELLTTSDLLPLETPDSEAAEYNVESLVADVTSTMTLQRKQKSTADGDSVEHLETYAWFTGTDLQNKFPAIKPDDLRVPSLPEDCCICRSVQNDQVATSVIQSIGRDQIIANQENWTVSLDASDFAIWHGAPVVAMADGKVIGVFLASKSGAMIAPLK